jgi:hypothetical protein
MPLLRVLRNDAGTLIDDQVHAVTVFIDAYKPFIGLHGSAKIHAGAQDGLPEKQSADECCASSTFPAISSRVRLKYNRSPFLRSTHPSAIMVEHNLQQYSSRSINGKKHTTN